MPRVTTTNDATQAVYDEAVMAEYDIDPPGVRFADTGTSQEIPAGLAEALVNEYDTITPYE
jgi:hypothetical protein